MRFMNQHSYDFSTEGKDPVSKMAVAVKAGFVASVVAGGYDVVLRRPAYSLQDAVTRSGKHFLYWTAITTTYAATIFVLTNLRKKDDSLNYALAAIPTAGVINTITRSSQFALSLGTIGFIGGVLFKTAVNNGYKPFDLSDVRPRSYREGFDFISTP